MDLSKESKLAVDVGKTVDKSASLKSGVQLCGRVSSRLVALLAVLRAASDDQRARVADTFDNVVTDFLHALRLQNHYRFALYWVATCQKLVVEVCVAHRRVDEIYKELGVEEEDPDMKQWRDKLPGDRVEQIHSLADVVERMSTIMIINQTPSPTKFKEGLAMLANQLRVWSVHNPYSEKQPFSGELKLSVLQAHLMRTTLGRFGKDAHLDLAFDWYVPPEDIQRTPVAFKEGTFGKLYEGTLTDRATRSRRKVAIKHIDTGMTTLDDNFRFSRELTSWHVLKNEHILEMLGANHVSKPKFFVSEYASEGNFTEFFGEEANHKLLWKLFIQAAEGLTFLHENNIEHGGLKCTNILLSKSEDDDNSPLVVKLSDFGMSVVRTESVSVSVTARGQSVRYKSPERLTQTSGPTDYRRADIYSLGLCIYEAASGEIPFGMTTDDEIITSKLQLLPMERPEAGFTDREWTLVASMCDNNPSNRPALPDIIEEMKQLDVLRAAGEAVEAVGA